MSAILRWFDVSGERHRAYFRDLDDASRRRLVIAGRGWQHAVDGVTAARLEDLPEEMLAELARRCRPAEPDPNADLALGAD